MPRRQPDLRRVLPQLRDQRARHRRAGRRLRRADRQRRRRRACSGYQSTRVTPVRDRRHLPAARVELHRLDPDLGDTRTRSQTTRRSSRSSTATSAPRPRCLTGTITLCFTAACGRAAGRRLTAAAGDVRRGELRRRAGGSTSAAATRASWPATTPWSTRAADGSYIDLAETLPTGVSLTTEQIPTTDQTFTATRRRPARRRHDARSVGQHARCATRTTSGSTTTPRSTGA